jgi:hypothetical protein
VGKAQRAHQRNDPMKNGGHGASAPLSYCVIFDLFDIERYWLRNKDIWGAAL